MPEINLYDSVNETDLDVYLFSIRRTLLRYVRLLASQFHLSSVSLPSLTKSLHFLNPATVTFVNFAVSAHISTSKQPAPLPPLLSILNLITVTPFITTFQTINLTGSNRSRTLLLVLLLRLLNDHISLPFSNLSTGLRSKNALNINFFFLPIQSSYNQSN